MKKIVLNLINILMLLTFLVTTVVFGIAFLHYYHYDDINALLCAATSICAFVALILKLTE